MMCPVCKIDMMVMEYRQIEIDFCHKCSGIWFDRGELELLLKRSAPDSAGPTPPLEGITGETRSHGKRKCPICGKKMKEVPIGAPAIYVDVCRHGDGIWFDGGELQALLKQTAAGPIANEGAIMHITAYLGDTFQTGKLHQ
jgi:Zn-finger nucleic acid-binding protein